MTIRHVARLLGKFSSSFIAVPEGRLHYRSLDHSKNLELARRRGKFDKFMWIPEEAKADIRWWQDNIMAATSPIFRPHPTISISTDASLLGWWVGGKF